MAARARVKKKDHEKLDFDNIEKVISLLEQAKPITKKEACERLNIAYSTARLAKIIEEHKHQKAVDEKRRAANRGKPASDFEIRQIIESYLEGDSIQAISQSLYRSTQFVRNIIDSVGVPQRKAGQTYAKFEPLPEQCISDKFEPGEIVWSSKYQATAEILKEVGKTVDDISNVYKIYVLEKIEEDCPFKNAINAPSIDGVGGFYANQPAYDLGKLSHLTKFGVNVRKALNATSTRASTGASGD